MKKPLPRRPRDNGFFILQCLRQLPHLLVRGKTNPGCLAGRVLPQMDNSQRLFIWRKHVRSDLGNLAIVPINDFIDERRDNAD
jgi:hypothetical protein